MNRGAQSVFAVVGTALLLGGIGAASGPSWRHQDDGKSRLRLSWGARPERIEVCRTLSEAELADRPEHMRQRVQCEGSTATYTLQVRIDGAIIDARVLRGGGLRHDRPMYLLDDLAVAPGEHHLVVTLTRREEEPVDRTAGDSIGAAAADTGIFAGRAEREREERARRKRAAIPASLLLDTVVTFEAHRVQLVTFDSEEQQLQLHRSQQIDESHR